MDKLNATKKSGFMNPLYSFCYIVLIILAYPAVADDLPAESLSENSSIETASSPADDINRLFNESNLLLNAIASKNIPLEKEELFVIGEVALSRAEKNLDKLSRDNQSSKLVETGGFEKLYSDMSSAFGMQKIPIKLSMYEPPQKQISIENNLSSERELIRAPIQPEYRDQFEPNPPTPRMFEISEGFTETSGGVNVIWDY